MGVYCRSVGLGPSRGSAFPHSGVASFGLAHSRFENCVWTTPLTVMAFPTAQPSCTVPLNSLCESMLLVAIGMVKRCLLQVRPASSLYRNTCCPIRSVLTL